MSESLPSTTQSPLTASPSATPSLAETEPPSHSKPSLYTMISDVAAECGVESDTAKQFIIAYCRTSFSATVVDASFDLPDPGRAARKMVSLYYLPYCMEAPQSRDSLDMPLGRGIIDHCIHLFEGIPESEEVLRWQKQILRQLRRPEGPPECRQTPAVQSTEPPTGQLMEPFINDRQCGLLHTAWLVSLRSTKDVLERLSGRDPTRATVDMPRCENARQWLWFNDLIPEWLTACDSRDLPSVPRISSRERRIRRLLPAPVQGEEQSHWYHADPAEFITVQATSTGFQPRSGGDSYQQ